MHSAECVFCVCLCVEADRVARFCSVVCRIAVRSVCALVAAGFVVFWDCFPLDLVKVVAD
jgi:hypothetical protein